MRIELSLKRPGGSPIEFPPNTVYLFKPTENDPRHTAEVTDPVHIKALLAIPEYSIADMGDAPVVAQVKPVNNPLAVKRIEPVKVEGTADPDSQQAETDGGQTVDATGGDSGDATGAGDGDKVEQTGETIESVRAAYEAATGQKAHPKASIDTLKTRMAALAPAAT